MTLATLLTNIGSIFTAMMGWVGDVLDVIAEQPILLLFVVGTFALVAVGVVRRLLRL